MDKQYFSCLLTLVANVNSWLHFLHWLFASLSLIVENVGVSSLVDPFSSMFSGAISSFPEFFVWSLCPLWTVRMCFFKSPAWKNAFPQESHLWSFSSFWTEFMCFQVSLIRKCLSTWVTFVIFLSIMNWINMSFQVSC